MIMPSRISLERDTSYDLNYRHQKILCIFSINRRLILFTSANMIRGHNSPKEILDHYLIRIV